MLLAKYGVRAGEITRLRLDDVDWRKEIIRVRHTKTGVTSYLPLLPEVGEAILSYLQKVASEDIFSGDLHPQPGTLSACSRVVRASTRRSGAGSMLRKSR